ncbi:hypothetical protein [Candidatus Vallotia lariciata]|nr:hypothetical protein [Candidatus Vallotia lariciata]
MKIKVFVDKQNDTTGLNTSISSKRRDIEVLRVDEDKSKILISDGN